MKVNQWSLLGPAAEGFTARKEFNHVSEAWSLAFVYIYLGANVVKWIQTNKNPNLTLALSDIESTGQNTVTILYQYVRKEGRVIYVYSEGNDSH